MVIFTPVSFVPSGKSQCPLYRRLGGPQIHFWTPEEEYCLPFLQRNLEHFQCRWVCNFWGCGLPFGVCLRCPVETARIPKSYSTRLPGNLVASQNICITSLDQVVISSPPASKYGIENVYKPKICISIKQCICVVGPLLYIWTVTVVILRLAILTKVLTWFSTVFHGICCWSTSTVSDPECTSVQIRTICITTQLLGIWI